MTQEIIDYVALKKRGFLRQRQEGFFVLRTRQSCGVYSKEQLEKLAEIASRYAKGFLHLTVRQGIEIPFIKYEDIPSIEKELGISGILTGTSGARLRATTCCPGNNWCRQGLVDTFSLANRIENELQIRCGLDLPHKFKIAISGCPNACMRAQSSEIGIHGQAYPQGSALQFGYVVYLGGCAGKNPRLGFKLDKIFSEEEVLSLVGRVVKFYKKQALPKQRLGAFIEQFGKESFLKEASL